MPGAVSHPGQISWAAFIVDEGSFNFKMSKYVHVAVYMYFVYCFLPIQEWNLPIIIQHISYLIFSQSPISSLNLYTQLP